ncbi:17635_t:CDS:2, partial [Dentiscutata erythropus]
NPNIISPDLDVPSDVLPYVISKDFNTDILKQSFRNWTELSLVTWTRYIIEKHELENEPEFAEKFLSCIPTQFGVKRPNEAYFQDVTLFSDLPNISIKGNEEFFKMLGIHKHVELDRVFSRLVNNENLNHMKLVEYFAKQVKNLKANDVERLKTSAIWIKESDDNNKSDTNVQRYLAKELYAPYAQNRELELP